MTLICYLLTLHFISDFLTQWDKTGFYFQKTTQLLSHCFSYSVFIFIGAFIVLGFDIKLSFVFALYNGIMHLIIDSITNYLGGVKKKKKYWNYMLIGINQLILLLILFQSFYYLTTVIYE